MVYRSKQMTYRTVMKVLCGKVNDVEVCEAMQNGTNGYYTLWVVKEHDTVKKLIRVMEHSASKYECCIELFTWQNCLCVVFAYVGDRRLDAFYPVKRADAQNCAAICGDLVLKCMTSKLAYPLLYLVLKQNQVYLYDSTNIELGYGIDLEELDENCGDKACVRQCALNVRTMLQQGNVKRNTAYQLVVKKIPKHGYKGFDELYRDVRLSMSVMRRRKPAERIRTFLNRHRTGLFRLLLLLCAVCAAGALFHLTSKALLGDSVFVRIWINHFKMIGTESMMK